MTELNSKNKAYEVMLLEHEKLHSLLDELKQMFFERKVAFSEVSSRLVLLQALVEEHFRTEEGSDCFEDVVSHAPHVSDKVAVLVAEHAAMSACIDQLVVQASSCQGVELDWDEIGTGYEAFADKLLLHETAENELLQEVFTEDIGSKD